MRTRSVTQVPHAESHFTSSEVVRDIVIGMSDGLTVPFALAAGLSGAVTSTNLIVTAGLAEIAAGSIAMGLGGFLAARGDAEHYASERRREEREIEEIPDAEALEVVEVLGRYGVEEREATLVVDALRRRPQQWVDFMMRFELGLEQPEPRRAVTSATTIALSYVAGGLVPLGPYMGIHNAATALPVSVGITLLALGIFGYIKGHFTGARPLVAAAQTVLIGGVAGGAAFVLARLFSHA